MGAFAASSFTQHTLHEAGLEAHQAPLAMQDVEQKRSRSPTIQATRSKIADTKAQLLATCVDAGVRELERGLQ
ncbi:hypothetical protein PMIN06_012948 [Paraphaeosphaeria minitans]|uniref:Uncharacterized protein n=1 Tax=Paraphaeosphaeria minitans TaxID=565426 RepID=A0A9P6KKQ1_9PLEO|nr:hypothetical protein PMIN01_11948 [Paraphaeosphaeria minitans]